MTNDEERSRERHEHERRVGFVLIGGIALVSLLALVFGQAFGGWPIAGAGLLFILVICVGVYFEDRRRSCERAEVKIKNSGR